MFLIGLVESQRDRQIEDLMKRVERKKWEAYPENDLKSKNNGNTSDEYNDYEIRVWCDMMMMVINWCREGEQGKLC